MAINRGGRAWYVVYGRRSHKIKQTHNTNACSMAREGAAAYSLARRMAVAVTGVISRSHILTISRVRMWLRETITGESGEAAACSLAREGRRRQYLGPGVKLRNRC